jgi:hypothetical protein
MPAEPAPIRRYAWRRFWTKPGASDSDGWFYDPWAVVGLEPRAARLSDLVTEPCAILLGEPGLGKSHAIRDAAVEPRFAGWRVHEVDLGAYDEGESLIGAIVDSVAWRDWRASDDALFLFLDGLDEALLHIKAIHRRLIAELKQAAGDLYRLRLRISCRTAEWLPDFDEQLAEVFNLLEGLCISRSRRYGKRTLRKPREPRASMPPASSRRSASAG